MSLTTDDIVCLKRLLARHESFSPVVYKDSRGFNTIGYGTLLDPPGGISIDEAWQLALNRLGPIEERLCTGIQDYRELVGPRKHALIDMAYNLGVDGLKGFRKMLGAVIARDWETAAHEALASDWAKQVGRRSEDIAAMLREEKYP